MQHRFDGIPPRPRPAEKTPDIIRAVAERLVDLPDMKGDGSLRSQSIDNLVSVLSDNLHDWDGFNLGKDLDRTFFWQVDSAMVDDLDMAERYAYEEHRKIVAKWVADEGIKPLRAVGDPVTHEGHAGTITRIDSDTAHYIINVPALGHVPPGSKAGGTTGVILPFEEIDDRTLAAAPTG